MIEPYAVNWPTVCAQLPYLFMHIVRNLVREIVLVVRIVIVLHVVIQGDLYSLVVSGLNKLGSKITMGSLVH